MVLAAILDNALPIVGILVGIAVIFLIIEIIRTLKTARATVTDLTAQMKPTLDNVNQLTEDLKPIVAAANPMMDRVNLTIDAANLEIMRVDHILENVSDMTDELNTTTSAVTNIVSAPVNIAVGLTDKVTGWLKSPGSSKETKALAEGKASPEVQARASFDVATMSTQDLLSALDAIESRLNDESAAQAAAAQAPAYVTVSEPMGQKED